MRRFIVLFLVLVSLSFQMTYPISSQEYMPLAQHAAAMERKERMHKKLTALFQKYGKAKVRGALAMIRKHTPKGLIARLKEAAQQVELTKKAYEGCITNHCAQEEKVQKVAWNKYRLNQNYEAYREKASPFWRCRDVRCQQELKAHETAVKRYLKTSFALAIASELGMVAAMFGLVGMASAMADQYEKRTAKIPWQESPLYQPPDK